MNSVLKTCSIVCTVLLLVGCATTRQQPAFEQPTTAQQHLQLLDETLITVKVNDPYDIVKRVEGIVLEDTTGLIFPFQDNGEKGDAVAHDDVWSIKVKVPYDSWAGTFTFQITAYNADREPIIVRDALNEVAPMQTTLELEVQLPEEKAEVK